MDNLHGGRVNIFVNITHPTTDLALLQLILQLALLLLQNRQLLLMLAIFLENDARHHIAEPLQQHGGDSIGIQQLGIKAMQLLCRYIGLAACSVAFVVIDVLALDGICREWQTIFGATDMSFEGKAGRFRFDLVNARPSA